MTSPFKFTGRSDQASSVDELVFNRDLDFSAAEKVTTWKFEPSYASSCVHRLGQHPVRGTPAFQLEEPAYPRASMPHILADDRLRRNRIQVTQSPYHHAFVTEKLINLPPPDLATSGNHRIMSKSYLARSPTAPTMPTSPATTHIPRYGPMVSRQPFGQSPGRHRFFVGDVRVGVP